MRKTLAMRFWLSSYLSQKEIVPSILIIHNFVQQCHENASPHNVIAQDVNFPKFLEMDLPLFEGIISDLFPGRKRPVLDYGALNSVMKLVIQEKGLQPHPFFTTKVRASSVPSIVGMV